MATNATALTGAPYDYTKDPAFLSAPVQQQDAYLKANDPGYAQADGKTQGAYLSHLRGYDQATQFEQQNAPQQTEGGVLGRTGRGVLRGLNNVVEGAYQTMFHPINTVENAVSNTEQNLQQARSEPSTVGKIADYASALPFLGPLGKSLGQRAAGGDYAGAISEGLTTAAAPAVAKEALSSGVVRSGVRAVRGALQDAAYKELPTNGPTLTPAARGIARAGGAALGEGLAGPGGGVAGALAGPSFLQMMVGSPETGDIRNPGPFSKIPIRLRAAQAPTPLPFSPEGSSISAGDLPPTPEVQPSESATTSTGMAIPSFLTKSPTPPEGEVVDTIPLRPTVGSPEEWNAYEQRMRNLKAEASDAGTYSAARGKVGRKLNYQERIGKDYQK